jgi:hypothetical protein
MRIHRDPKSLRRLTRFVDLLRGEFGANVRLFESMERDQLQPDSIVLSLLAQGSSVELLDVSVDQLAESQRCAAPTCPVTMADCHLKLCTGCKVAKYCSRRCQKGAWTHVTTSHRMWCASVGDIRLRVRAPAGEIGTAVDARSTAHYDNYAPPIRNKVENHRIVLGYLQALVFLKLQSLNPGVNFGLIHRTGEQMRSGSGLAEHRRTNP